MTIHRSTFVILLVVLLLCQGCRTLGTMEDIYDSQDPYHGGNYREVLDHWTQKVRIYIGGFDVELIAAATFKSVPFREAYTAEYARTQKLSKAETTKMLSDQRAAAASYTEFTVAAFTPDKRWNDFTEKEPIWHVYLTRNGVNLVKPVEIRRVKNVDAVTMHFYPYISPWDVVYKIRFPAQLPGSSEDIYRDAAMPVKLVITGVRGNAEMIWKQ